MLVIAEIGSTHDGSFGNAKCLIDAAAECGVDAVKFQTHIAEAETLPDAPAPPFFKDEPRFEYFKRTAFHKAQWVELKAHAENKGLVFLSSPFCIEAVQLLEEIGVSRYKIPSGEVTNLPMLDLIARTGKPMLLSSGMSPWAKLDEAVNTILSSHVQALDMRRMDRRDHMLQLTYYVDCEDKGRLSELIYALSSGIPDSSFSFVEQDHMPV